MIATKEAPHSVVEVDKLLSEVKALKKSLQSSESEHREVLQLVQRKNSEIDSLNGIIP